MQFPIEHELPGRIRFRLGGIIPERDAIALEELFLENEWVEKTVAYPLAGCLTVFYGKPHRRDKFSWEKQDCSAHYKPN